MVKKEDNSGYTFVETIISPDLANDWLNKK
ncbi:MAG: hypothetical protein ACO39T_06725 [Flavobacteriaceae bacterium]